MGLFCPLGIARFVPAKAKTFGHIINPLLTELVRSGWLDIGLFFLRFYGPRLPLGPSKRKKELGQYPAILTSRLVNNVCVGHFEKYHNTLLCASSALIGVFIQVPFVTTAQWNSEYA